MQPVAGKEWCMRKADAPRLGREPHQGKQGSGWSATQKQKTFETSIKNSPSIVAMASQVYTDNKIYQIVQFNMCSFVCQLSCLKKEDFPPKFTYLSVRDDAGSYSYKLIKQQLTKHPTQPYSCSWLAHSFIHSFHKDLLNTYYRSDTVFCVLHYNTNKNILNPVLLELIATYKCMPK